MSVLAELREQLYILASVDTDLKYELIPSLIGKGIEKKGFFNGLCYSLISNDSILQTQLSDRLEAIKKKFHLICDQIHIEGDLHLDSMIKEVNQNPYDLPRKEKSERRLLEICTYLNPFIKQILKELDLPYIRFLIGDLDKNFYRHFRYAKLVQKAKNIELTTKCPIPFQPLYKMATGLSLKAKENDLVDQWLKTLNDAKSFTISTFKGDKENLFVGVRYLHRFLLSLAHFLSFDCTALEIKLVDKGCTVFFDPDPILVRIRKKLKEGSVCVIQGKKYTIDSCLCNRNNQLDQPMVFKIKEDSNYQIVFDQNEAIRSIYNKFENKYHFGIILPLQKEKEGGMALIESCIDPLSSIKWQSDDFKISDSDVIEAQPIVELLVGLTKQPCTPFPLSPDYFAFNGKNEMRALCLMQVGNKSFEALEKFVWECSLNEDKSLNPAIFTYLMHSGKLADLPHSAAYRDLIGMSLEGKDINEAVSLKGVITCPKALDSRKTFYLSMQGMQQKMIMEIQAYYNLEDDKKLKKEIRFAMEFIHRRDCPGSLIIQEFYERSKFYLLTQLKLAMQPAKLYPLRLQLIQNISSSNLSDQKIQEKWRNEFNYQIYGIFNKYQQEEIYYQAENKYKSNKI